MVEIDIRICQKKINKKMRMGKNTEKMPEKDKQRKYKIHEQIQKNHSFNVLKKIWKKEKKLNSVEIDVVTNFIKDE